MNLFAITSCVPDGEPNGRSTCVPMAKRVSSEAELVTGQSEELPSWMRKKVERLIEEQVERQGRRVQMEQGRMVEQQQEQLNEMVRQMAGVLDGHEGMRYRLSQNCKEIQVLREAIVYMVRNPGKDFDPSLQITSPWTSAPLSKEATQDLRYLEDGIQRHEEKLEELGSSLQQVYDLQKGAGGSAPEGAVAQEDLLRCQEGLERLGQAVKEQRLRLDQTVQELVALKRGGRLSVEDGSLAGPPSPGASAEAFQRKLQLTEVKSSLFSLQCLDFTETDRRRCIELLQKKEEQLKAALRSSGIPSGLSSPRELTGGIDLSRSGTG